MAEEGQAFKEIFIQQDRVENHICEDDKDFKDALMEKGINLNSTHKQQTHWTLACWIWRFSEPSRVSMMLC